MEIHFLEQLEKNPARDSLFTNKGLELKAIIALEQKYNNGNPFPLALRELLYLAGKYCIIFDYGLNDTQDELQEFVRENLQEVNKTISRPFFAIDVYNVYDQFLYLYLDEGDNPPISVALYSDNSTINQQGWSWKIQPSLSKLVNSKIQRIKDGFNPF